MSDVSATQTLSSHLIANGSQVVRYYTDSEILKIEIAGAVLVIAVLVVTYALYSAWRRRYNHWVLQKEMEERVANGDIPDPSEYQMEPAGINKGLIYLAGALIMVIGIILVVM